MPHHFTGNGIEERGKQDTRWDEIHTFGFQEGRSATEISTAIRLSAAARERGPQLCIITCSMDVKQAFDNVSPENLGLVMKEMNMAQLLAEAILREQSGGKYDICLQGTRIPGIPFDKSIKQGEGESVLVQPDDEERLQGFARMEGAADGCQDQE